jgi:FAD/FMN-containing dehydrogenase/Fe-S oxidoreductase
MVTEFEQELRATLTCDIHFDSLHRKIYSVDASIYEIEPIGIIIPRTPEDAITAIKIAHKYHVPVIARGAATGITGGCLGKALIIDHSTYLNHILEINFHEQYAVCQPGVVQDHLNKVLSVHNFRLGPDTSTGDRATLGGMTANNSAGARSLYYGKMVDHVIGIELVLTNGEIIYFEAVDEAALAEKLKLQNTEGHIYREIVRIRDQYRDEIDKHFPKIPRRVSGYNLDELLKPGPLNICKLITGSEGTLGFLTKIKVNIAKKPLHQGLCVVFFNLETAVQDDKVMQDSESKDYVNLPSSTAVSRYNSIHEAFQAVPHMLEHHPLSLELIDDQIINRGKESPAMRGKLEWLKGHPLAFIVAEFHAESPEVLQDKISRFEEDMHKNQIGYDRVSIFDEKVMEQIWTLRKSGLGLLLSKRSYSRAIAFIEDLSVDPMKLPAFMQKFQAYLKSIGKEAGIYGHVGSGCMHVRPYIDLRDPNELFLMQKMMDDVSDLILEFGGSLSGEHGDGIVRTWLNKKMFGNRLYQAFQELKAAFDPDHLMNPGKIISGQPFLENLRLNPDKPISKLDTFLDFSKEGGFELAVDLCNGNGLCRKSTGTMCPSFQATENEYDSTRARAQSLRSLIHGPDPMKHMADEELRDVLDLCLQCKGCKTECPSQVDMAKMKTEFLYHYQKSHGLSLRNKLFGHLSTLFSIGSRFPKLTNFMLGWRFTKFLADKIGISSNRSLPSLAKKKFSSFDLPKHEDWREKVILFNDTYTEFLSPEIGLAAHKVLQSMGFEVVVPPWKCCGRPLLSKGLLPQAKAKAFELIELLLPYAKEGLPIIGLEPSCILTIIDDYPALAPCEDLHLLVKAAIPFDQFISNQIQDGKFTLPSPINTTVKYHIHCYQKALIGSKFTENILKSIPNCEAVEIKSGCCGMAGAFGYEKEHYDISMKIGSLTLFPTIKHTPATTGLIANGFSCRAQIQQGTGRHAVHLAQFLETLDL